MHDAEMVTDVSETQAAPTPARLAEQARAKAPIEVTGAQSLVLSLESMDVDTVFGIPGGAILPAYDPLLDSVKVRHILVRHEQGAGHAAEGYASATGKVGVCMATSGPGATNLVTALADAHMDSVPIVAITGQVASASIGTDAFQEADIRGITMPITKHNYLVTDAAQIPRVIAEAFHIAATGRPGPVLVDISKDALQARTTFAWPPRIDLPGYHPVTRPHAKQIREAARLIAAAERPVLYVGGGVIRADACEELRQFVELTRIPVVTTLMARGALPDSHELHLGMPGMHGSVAAVTALQKADLLITLGARFDDRVTGQLSTLRARGQGHPRRHRPGRDLQEPQGRRADRRRPARTSSSTSSSRSTPTSTPAAAATTPQWRERTQGWKRDFPARLRRARGRHPRPAVRHRAAQRDRRTRGASTSPASASTRCGRPSSSSTSARAPGSTPVASGRWGMPSRPPWVPRSASPTRTVWAIDGDGCFQMTNQELATCVINNIPIKVAVINNSSLGMVRQWQSLFYNERYSNTDLHTSHDGTRIPDFVKLADAYGCVGLRCETPEDVDETIRQAMAVNDRPVVVDFVVHRDAMVWPMVPAGVSNDAIQVAKDTAPQWDREERGVEQLADHDGT